MSYEKYNTVISDKNIADFELENKVMNKIIDLGKPIIFFSRFVLVRNLKLFTMHNETHHLIVYRLGEVSVTFWDPNANFQAVLFKWWFLQILVEFFNNNCLREKCIFGTMIVVEKKLTRIWIKHSVNLHFSYQKHNVQLVLVADL